jgi:hypothetical protein
MTGMNRHTLPYALAALLLAGSASSAALAGEPPARPGQTATLRIELELTGKDRGKPIHRTVSMVVHVVSQETTGYDLLASGDDAPAAAAAGERRDARLDQRLAAARAHQEKLDMDAITRACDADQQSAECKRGQAAFAQAMGEVDQAMREAANDAGNGAPTDPNRYQQWAAVPGKDGQSCGTIEARVLDQGKAEVTRIPRPGVLAVDTCSSSIALDRTGHRTKLYISPLEILRANATDRGDIVIDGTDVNVNAGSEFNAINNSLILRNNPYQASGSRLSGSATYRGSRGVTVVRWSLTPD